MTTTPQESMNILAGTTDEETIVAANTLAGLTGKPLIVALNEINGTAAAPLPFRAVCNALAGTTGMDGTGALSLLAESGPYGAVEYLFSDGFEDGNHAAKWAVTGTIGAGGRNNLGVTTGEPRYDFAASESDRVAIGFSLTRTDAHFLGIVCTFSEGAGTTEHMMLGCTAAGKFSIVNGSFATQATGTADGPAVSASAYVEIELVVADAGTMKVWVDGVLDLDYAGDTRNGGVNGLIDGVRLWAANSPYTYDDFYLLTGPSAAVTGDPGVLA